MRQISFLLLAMFGLTAAGCNRAEPPVAAPVESPSAAELIEDKDQIVGPIDPNVPAVIPNQLLTIRWDSARADYVQTEGPNQLKVRLLNENEYAAGHGGGSLPFVVPGTKKLCYSAIACTRPECARQGKNGRPFLFASLVKGLTVGENGRLDFGKLDPIDAKNMDRINIAPCPLCKSPEHVQLYIPPEVRKKKKALEKELADSRVAYRVARINKQSFPEGTYRTPMVILDEINTLPRLFLQVDPTTLAVGEVVQQSEPIPMN